MFEFQNPAAFFLLLLIPLLYILRKFKIFQQMTFQAVLADWNGRAFVCHGKIRKILSIFAKFLLGASFVFAVTALADPVVSHQEKVYTTLGTDIVFVLDTSPSMAAKDIDGRTRLQASLEAVKSLVQTKDGCRYGLVALGSNASVLVPPTNNISIFNERCDSVQVGLFGNGSAIGDGISTAVCHLVSSTAPKKCIILLTDGENNAGEIHPETASRLAAENNITLYVVGVGSKGTVPIEYIDPVTGKSYSGYLDSDFSSASLKKIASIGNGRYFEVRTLDDLVSTLAVVSGTENVTQNFTYRIKNDYYYQNILFIAIICIVASWIIKRIILKEMSSFKLNKVYLIRSIFNLIAFIMLILAYAGLSWGTYLVPVQKSCNSVAMVFDISNSMLAKDGPQGLSRLESSSVYAKKLLERMQGQGVTVSAVLAKGEGIEAIPQTEDSAIIESLLDSMSPSLMTVPGTSLAKGILAAKRTFTTNYATAGRIWVFTDGEETDGQLAAALTDCVRSGIPVSIIGFGKETETQVLAGDNTTIVNTALRSNRINKAIDEAQEKNPFVKNQTPIVFVDSTAHGSAAILLSQLQQKSEDGLSMQITAYEAKSVLRYKFFLILSILAFAFSFVFTEFNFSKIVKGIPVLCVFVFMGCSSDTTQVLKGTYAWQKKQYRRSVSCFMNVVDNARKTQNEQVLYYALYDLGTSYALLGEDESAMQRFSEIPDDAPDSVRYSAYYNAGIIAHKNEKFDEAQQYFRKALEIDSTKIEAKVNMELSIQQSMESVRQNENQIIPTQEEKEDISEMEKAVFKRIKENDLKQWKNSESSQPQNLAEDY